MGGEGIDYGVLRSILAERHYRLMANARKGLYFRTRTQPKRYSYSNLRGFRVRGRLAACIGGDQFNSDCT